MNVDPSRTANGHCEYTDDAEAKVLQIKRLIHAGLSTRDIASMMPCVIGTDADFVSCPELLATMQAREQQLAGQIETLTGARDALRAYAAGVEVSGARNRPWCAATANE